jgi:hypothetical protein
MSKIISKEVKEFIQEKLNEKFFKSNIPNEISPYNIINITMQPNVLENEIVKMLPENKKAQLIEENKIVENENNTDKLYNLLRKELNPSTVNMIIEKLLKVEKEIMPKLVQDLKRSGNDNFVEAAARLLVKAENNYSKELADILSQIKYPYTQAVMCFVLGKIGLEEHIETVYKYFLELKKNYTNENYYEGPLVGLHEMKKRYEL